MPRPIDKQSAYYPGLDGIRAIAVALVIAYHVGVPHMGGGLLGVGVFFTLSGYLITSILLSAWNKRGNLGLSTFWLRRARRLLPAVILVLIVVLLATLIVDSSKFGSRANDSFWALFYVANWATIIKGQSYFDRFNGPSPLEHLWSLSVEEQFYVFWPLLLLLMLKVFKGKLKSIAGVTIALGVVSMILLALFAHAGQDATRAYEGTDTRAGGLLWGAALAMLWHPKVAAGHQAAARRIGLDVLGVIGLIGIVTLVATTTQTTMFIYRGGIALLTLATCAVLMAAVHPETMVAKVLSLAPLRWIGERTYGIYLWHMPVAAFLPERTFYGNTLLRGIIVVALTVLIASLSWTLVEDPIRKWGVVGAWRRGTAPLREGGRKRALPPFVAMGAVLTLFSTAALAGVNKLPQTSVQEIAKEQAKEQSKTPAAKKAAEAPKAKPDATRTKCEAVVHIGDSTSLGLEDGPSTNITDPKKRIRARYQAVGVKKVVEDIKGGRNIIEHFGTDTNGKEAVQQHIREGFKGCWVIALGMNDAATMAKGGTPFTADMRIDTIMKLIGNQPVLWVNTVTQAWTNNPLYANKNMQEFNTHLISATKRYPNLRVYDWAAEALPHPDWFLQDDANHNNGPGSTAKAEGISKALVAAFPQGMPASKQPVVVSK